MFKLRTHNIDMTTNEASLTPEQFVQLPKEVQAVIRLLEELDTTLATVQLQNAELLQTLQKHADQEKIASIKKLLEQI